MAESSTFSALAADARYALRAVRKDLRLFIFSAFIVGLGIGACTSVFSVLSPLMLRQLPLFEPDRLVWIANDGEGGMSAVTSRTSNLMDFRELSQSFDGLTGYFAFFEQRTYNLVDGAGEPEQLVGVDVAQNFLDVLGVQPAQGRNFVEEEGIWEGRAAVILSHDFWLRRFNGDPTIVGRPINLNNSPSEVVGVLPPSFDFASAFAPQTRIDFLRPFPISSETDRWGNTLSIIGRLKPGATIESAQHDLDLVIDGLRNADSERWGLGAVVSDLQSRLAGPFRSAFLLLAAAAAAVMLIVCVNLSNLLLAKGTKRAEEMAVRSALGAPRSRLIRQLLLESLILSASGATLGLLIAVVTTQFVANHSALNIPLLRTVSVDPSALLFASALALIVGTLVGLIPAFQVTNKEASVFRGAGRGLSASLGSTRLREGLVIAEVAIACILLVFGGLLLKSFQNVLDVKLGFEPEHLVTWQVTATRSFDGLQEETAYFEQLVAGVQDIPGVEVAGLTDAIPLGRNRNWGISARGYEYNGEPGLPAFPHIVDSRYLQAMQIPLLRGRQFTPGDTDDKPTVVILNETAARSVFHGEPALGRTVNIGDWEAQIVGVVADVRHRSLEEGSGLQMYFPFTQIGDFGTLDMVVRSTLPASTLAQSVAAAMRAHDPTLPTQEYRTLDAVVERAVSPRRFTLQLLSAFSSTALLLAALGIYGVLSYAVSERIREIGIRMALGETAGTVLTKVVGKTLLLASIGLALGILGSFYASRWAGSLLYSVEPTDPATFVGMAVVLLTVSALAGLVPAWRASKTNIASVLKAS